MYENISNNLSTNIFESNSGVLNIAPIKLSGKYKIVVSNDMKLYLDDYTNRRVKIDMKQKFLPQVAKFLSISTFIVDKNKLKYGGFNTSTIKSYHIPLYISSENNSLPKYFVLSRVPNETITDSTNLQKYGDIIKFVDLTKLGISQIFKEILDLSNDRYEYPINFNWDDAKLDIFGYSLTSNTPIKKSISLLNNQSNQPYLEVFNNQIANTFVKENIIFPKFLNIEFEFNYVNSNIHFNNFFGYFSIGKEISKDIFNQNLFNVTIQDFNDKITWKQEKYLATIDLYEYINIIGTTTIIKINEQIAQLRIKINNISVDDYIRIYNSEGEIYFEYIIVQEDIKNTLRETLKSLCIFLSELSNRFLDFTVDDNYIITIKNNIEDIFIEEYTLDVTRNFILIDNNQNNFKKITVNDISLGLGTQTLSVLETYNKLKIDNKLYNIVEIFFFNGRIILRLDNIVNLTTSNVAEIYTINTTKLYSLPTIPYFSVKSDLKALEQYDFDKYVIELKELFSNQINIELKDIFNESVERFINKKTVTDILPYVIENENFELQLIDKIIYDKSINDNEILTMMFNSSGETCYITPNILNIDKQFYEKNGNINNNLSINDPIKFHWFLIKSKTPEYLLNDVRGLRYFIDKPKITSKLILNGELYSGQTFCETIFLGVKYQLPQKYENFQFAVYLNYNDEKYNDLTYSFEINNTEKTIYLSINKYLDFVDLIRGGDKNNEPFLDLSFLYNIRESFDTKSNSMSWFKSGSILFCDNSIPTIINNVVINDWKYQINNNWYICLKRNVNTMLEDFTDIFPISGDYSFYIYSSIIYNGEKRNYISMIYTVKNIHTLENDYLWCEDIEIKFFDTKNIFAQKHNLNPDGDPFIYYDIPKENIILNVDASDNIFGDNQIISTILTNSTEQTFKLINHNKIFSLKENYFEINREVFYNQNGSIPKQIINSHFYFPNFKYNTFTYQQLVDHLAINTFDNITNSTKITLFDRNQLWCFIKDLMFTDIKFKYNTEKQIINLINQLVVEQLNEYSKLKSIRVEDTEEFVKLNIIDNDINLVIWNTDNENKVTKINRYRGPYLPYLRILENELEFQADISTNFKTSLYNIYDKNFGGENISATGIWNEVQGNIVSSLFCLDTVLTINKPYDTVFDIRELLKNVINIDNAIITTKNNEFINNIDSNVDTYIVESYIDWLIMNVYKLTNVQNELGQNIKFINNTKNNYLINFDDINTYQTRFNQLIFNFTRY